MTAQRPYFRLRLPTPAEDRRGTARIVRAERVEFVDEDGMARLVPNVASAQLILKVGEPQRLVIETYSFEVVTDGLEVPA